MSPTERCRSCVFFIDNAVTLPTMSRSQFPRLTRQYGAPMRQIRMGVSDSLKTTLAATTTLVPRSVLEGPRSKALRLFALGDDDVRYVLSMLRMDVRNIRRRMFYAPHQPTSICVRTIPAAQLQWLSTPHRIPEKVFRAGNRRGFAPSF